MPHRRAVLVVVLSIAFAACGQKGPLYLPDAPEHPDAQPAPEDHTANEALAPSPDRSSPEQNELNNE